MPEKPWPPADEHENGQTLFFQIEKRPSPGRSMWLDETIGNSSCGVVSITLVIRGRLECSALLSRSRPRQQDYLNPIGVRKKVPAASGCAPRQ